MEKYREITGFLDVDELLEKEDVDKMFFRQIQMKGEKVMRKYPQQFADTKAKVLENAKIQYKMMFVPLNSIEGETVSIGQGTELESTMLSRVLAKSEEVCLCVMTVHGYDAVEEATDNGFEMLFIDGWGTALAECGNSLIKKKLVARLKEEDAYATSSWSPGQHQVDISLQEPLFEILRPEDIGVKLSETFMMYPKKSISGIIGFGKDADQEDIRPCDVCPKRETCPSAYA